MGDGRNQRLTLPPSLDLIAVNCKTVDEIVGRFHEGKLVSVFRAEPDALLPIADQSWYRINAKDGYVWAFVDGGHIEALSYGGKRNGQQIVRGQYGR